MVFIGDDLGDLAAFDAVDELRADGVPGLLVCSGSTEETALAERADLVVDGPAGVVALLERDLCRPKLSRGRRPGRLSHLRRWQPRDTVGEPLGPAPCRSASGIVSAACSASAVPDTSNGLTSNASSPNSSAAPASVESTTAQPFSDSTGISLATRFMPSRIGLTSSTSPIR